MASAKDKVIKGDYEGISCYDNGLHVVIENFQKKKYVSLTKDNVKSYEILDAEERKSGTSGVLRAGAGALILGPIGLAAGLTAKRKGIYTIAIEFYDGKRSLIEINEKLYKKFIQDVF